MSVGYGDTPYVMTFMSYEGGGIYDVNGISLSTGWGATGDWSIPLDQGTTFSLIDIIISTAWIYEYS